MIAGACGEHDMLEIVAVIFSELLRQRHWNRPPRIHLPVVRHMLQHASDLFILAEVLFIRNLVFDPKPYDHCYCHSYRKAGNVDQRMQLVFLHAANRCDEITLKHGYVVLICIRKFADGEGPEVRQYLIPEIQFCAEKRPALSVSMETFR